MKSVTKILGRIFPMNPNIPKAVLESARERGTAVHEWIEKYNEYLLKGGELPIIPLEYQMYADFYKKWVAEYEVVPIHSELKLSNEDMVGVLDLICKTKDHDQVLVDFKITYDYNLPYVELQSSAYNELAKHNEVIAEKIPQMLLHISKKGYSYIELEDQWEMFKKVQELDEYIDRRSKK